MEHRQPIECITTAYKLGFRLIDQLNVTKRQILVKDDVTTGLRRDLDENDSVTAPPAYYCEIFSNFHWNEATPHG